MPASTTVPLSVVPGADPRAAEAAVTRRKRQAAEAQRNLVIYYVGRASTPAGAVVAGIALLLMSESVGGALIATVCGIAVGQIVMPPIVAAGGTLIVGAVI